MNADMNDKTDAASSKTMTEDEDNQIKYRKTELGNKQQPKASRLSRLLTQSFISASMQRQSEGARCPCCNLDHKGLCPGTRPKSVFVESSSFDGDNKWLEAGSARRKSIDLSELASGEKDQSDRRNAPLAQEVFKTLDEEPSSASEKEREARAKNTDGGYAWLILAVIFIIDALIFGMDQSYGLIYRKIVHGGRASRVVSELPFVLQPVVENLSGPLCGCLLTLFESWRITVMSGSILVTLGHMLAALWADSHAGQLLSMSLMCGVGSSFLTISFFQINNAYFDRYRSTAFGIGLTGASVGSLFIRPLCQYLLDNYDGTHICYLALGLCVAPSVPLTFLLRQQSQAKVMQPESEETNAPFNKSHPPGRAFNRASIDIIWTCVKRIVSNPYFHLIWPTQFLFIWFSSIYRMTIFGVAGNRKMSAQHVSYMITCWALGKHFGRLFMSSLVDLKLLSYKSFTTICFASIGAATLLLNYTRLDTSDSGDRNHYLIILALVFILSALINLLYILLNILVVSHMDISLQPLTFGLSSFMSGLLSLLKFFDSFGYYDATLAILTRVSLCASLVWLVLPALCEYLKDSPSYNRFKQKNELSRESLSAIVPTGSINSGMTTSSEALELH